MKNTKILVSFLSIVTSFSLFGCGIFEEEFLYGYTSTDDVTLAKLIETSTPKDILITKDIFSTTTTYSGSGDELLDSSTIRNVYCRNSYGIYEINYITTSTDGYYSSAYFSTNSEDSYFYMTSSAGNDVTTLENDYTQTQVNNSLLTFVEGDASLKEVYEKDGKYIAVVETSGDTNTLTLEPENGRILSVVTTFPSVKGEGMVTSTMVFDYSTDQKIDYSAKKANASEVPAAASTTQESAEAGESSETSGNSATAGSSETAESSEVSGSSEVSETDGTSATTTEEEPSGFALIEASGPAVTLEAKDIYGNSFSLDNISNARLIMLNFWEPWCGPCVREMPDLQSLYEAYADKGLLIIGVYSTFSQDSDALSILKSKGISYPILKSNKNFSSLEQDYVPATYFLNANGNLLTEEPYAGSRDYDEWEEIIQSYLGE